MAVLVSCIVTILHHAVRPQRCLAISVLLPVIWSSLAQQYHKQIGLCTQDQMCPLRRESYTEVSSPKIEMERDHFYGKGAIHICGS